MKESLFFIAIVPNTALCDQIKSLKEDAYEKFGSKAALRSPAHITLHMPFKWREDREQDLTFKLDHFKQTLTPFEIELNGFGFFPPRVVFINVVPNIKLQELRMELVKHLKRELKLFNADYKDKPFHPHMTIAFRDLKKSIFNDAEKYYREVDFHALIEVNNICLLKHDGKVWQEHFYF